jgi:glycosyltransferase involved in cell wall biosynthesis
MIREINNIKTSIIIPVFNEFNYIETILNKINIEKKNLNLEIIVSDDGSNDGTEKFLESNTHLYDLITTSKLNQGKGNAINNALHLASGEITIIQDADLEYDPKDYVKFLKVFREVNADVVYGNRFNNNEYERLHYFSHKIANTIITLLVNCITNINFSDVECGLKAFKTKILKEINLKEKSFGFEIEITKKIVKKKMKIFQVPVNYNGRSYSEGKKIKLKDAFRALYCIFKY